MDVFYILWRGFPSSLWVGGGGGSEVNKLDLLSVSFLMKQTDLTSKGGVAVKSTSGQLGVLIENLLGSY